MDGDINQFAGTQTANRLVLTVGKFYITDIFDANKYANNPKSDFLNWTLINAGTFDYAGDAWGVSYGGAAELYVDRIAFRGGGTFRGSLKDMPAPLSVLWRSAPQSRARNFAPMRWKPSSWGQCRAGRHEDESRPASCRPCRAAGHDPGAHGQPCVEGLVIDV